MGDIAFLLIIFFMLLSEFAKDKDIQYDPATSEYVEKTEEPAALRVAIDENGVLYVDGKQVQSAEDIRARVEIALADTVSDSQRHIHLKVDRDQPQSSYMPVIEAITEGGGVLQMIGEIDR